MGWLGIGRGTTGKTDVMRGKLGPPCVADVPQILDTPWSAANYDRRVYPACVEEKVAGSQGKRLFVRSLANDVEPAQFRYQLRTVSRVRRRRASYVPYQPDASDLEIGGLELARRGVPREFKADLSAPGVFFIGRSAIFNRPREVRPEADCVIRLLLSAHLTTRKKKRKAAPHGRRRFEK